MGVDPQNLLWFHFGVGFLAALYYLWSGWRRKMFYLPLMIVPALTIIALGPVTPLAKLFRKIARVAEKNQERRAEVGEEEATASDEIW